MSPAQTCSDCPTILTPNPRRKGTRCRPCTCRANARSDHARAAVSTAIRRHWSDPDAHAKHREGISSSIRSKMASDPSYRAHRREHGRRLIEAFPPAPAGSTVRRMAGDKCSATKLDWCPPDYRAEYRRIREVLGKAALAKAAIIEMIHKQARDMERGLLPQDDFMKVRAALRWLRERGQANG